MTGLEEGIMVISVGSRPYWEKHLLGMEMGGNYETLGTLEGIEEKLPFNEYLL